MGLGDGALLLVDLAVILLATRLGGRLVARLGQPPVVGEVLAGLALGPSLLGLLPGDVQGRLFPADVRPALGAVAEIGVVLYVFLVGSGLDLAPAAGRRRLVTAVSAGSVALPFALGLLLALQLHPSHGSVDGAAVGLLPFALFVGASMAVTALPVLARILTDRGLGRTGVGEVALLSAAVNDVAAWLLLAVVLAVVASTGAGGLLLLALQTAAFVALLLGVARPLLQRLVRSRPGERLPGATPLVLIGLALCALATHAIGLHAVFGAFLFGAVLPADDRLQDARRRLGRIGLLLLPVFFATTGLRVDLSGFDGALLGELALVLLVACAGKLGGATAGALVGGMRGRRAATVGVLMNTRGLAELVLLEVGRSTGVLDQELFTVLVVMAVLTTLMTGPLLRLTYPAAVAAEDVR